MARAAGRRSVDKPVLQPLQALGYKRRIRFVALDQVIQACFIPVATRASASLLACVALLGLTHQHLAHLVVDEVVEEPAGVRQDLAGGLLIVWPQRVLDRVTRTAARR
jgi:hypothetical protein